MDVGFIVLDLLVIFWMGYKGWSIYFWVNILLVLWV